jgi:pyruvate, water dikinase
MDIPALIPLAEAGEYPRVEVGEQVKQLAKLQQRGIPIAETVVILSSTLEKIVEQSNLAQTLRKIIDASPKNEEEQAALLRQLQAAVRKVTLPSKITKEIFTWHNQNPGFIKVFTDSSNGQNAQENVSGDANLIDSILLVWSKQIRLDFQQRQLKLFAQPILIQHQGEPESSGIALTQSPTSKSKLQILSVWGAFDINFLEIEPDQFEVDLRTKQIVQKHLHPQYLQLQRKTDRLQEKAVLHYKQNQLSLENDQVLKLAYSIITIKRLFLDDHLVSWFYQAGQFFITDINSDSSAATPESKLGKTLLTGDSIQPGIVSGTIFNLTHKNQIGQLNHGQVVIVSQLTPDYLPALSKVAAVICDRGLSSPMLAKHIVQHSLPTIINTRHATKYLTPGLSVIVNANSGKVLAIAKDKTHRSPAAQATVIKTYVSAGNPHKAAQYITNHVDGVGVLRSEYTFASLGEHPKYLLNSKKRHQLKNALKKTIQAYRKTKKNLPLIYRTLDLTSQEFKALAFANSFEPNEPNPYLGYRGGLRTLNNFDLLDLEVEVLQEVALENNVPLGLMLPFVRTSSELQLINNYLAKKHHFKPGSKIGLWLQLNTPENILQIDHYLSAHLAGVSFNTRSIHALMHGVDPDNPEIFSLYPYDVSLMEKLLTKVMEAVKTKNSHHENMHAPTKAMVHVEDNNLRLVEIAAKLGYDIITVKPDFAPRAKQIIREIEEQKLTRI